MVNSAYRYFFSVIGWIINLRPKLGARAIYLELLLIADETRLLY